jgi:hypothetical protein
VVVIIAAHLSQVRATQGLGGTEVARAGEARGFLIAGKRTAEQPAPGVTS